MSDPRRRGRWRRRLILPLCLGALGCGEGRLTVELTVERDAVAPDGADLGGDTGRDRDAGDPDATRADGGIPDLGRDGTPGDAAAVPQDARADGELDATAEDTGHPGDAVAPDAHVMPSDASAVSDSVVEPRDAAVEPRDAAVEPRDAAVEPRDAAVEPPDAAPLVPCPSYDDPQLTGNLVDPALIEASGIVESRRNPGVLWIHNDAGDTARVFALTVAGEPLGIFDFGDPRPRDWEDMAVGPGPDPDLTYLYMGDIGDNAIRRENVLVRRAPEPEVARAPEPPTVRLDGTETFTLVYPDGPHNAETLLIDPRTSDVYVVVKSGDGVSPVFRAAAPLSAEGNIELEQVALLSFGAEPLRGGATTTGGDISPAGDLIIIRTYGSAFAWRRAPGATIGAALATEPCRLPLARERQGEAIGFAADDSGYYTVSEGQGSPLFFYARR